MTPDQFDSFRMGVDLTAANYSGGAGGTFADLVQGAGTWAVQSAMPSFETRNGLEGMLFTGSATESVVAEMAALHEATVVCIGQGATGTQPALFGGTYGGNSFRGYLNSQTYRTFAPPAPQASTSSSAVVRTAPTVFVSGFYPKGGELFSQINDLTPATSTGGGKDARINWPEIAIGQHRTSYFSGWIARVLVFDRALHARDPAGLASLVTAEMARVGL